MPQDPADIDDRHAGREHQGGGGVAQVVDAPARQYTITLEYFEDILTAEVQLEWESDRQTREVVPTSQLYAPGVSAPSRSSPRR